MRRHAIGILISLSVVGSSALATIPIPGGPGLLWRGDFDDVGGTFGNCDPTVRQDGYCHTDSARPAQTQIVTTPVAEGQQAMRFETGFGDQVPGQSGSRALLAPSLAAYQYERDEQWYRWQVFLPSRR
jgi:hypothetical protein